MSMTAVLSHIANMSGRLHECGLRSCGASDSTTIFTIGHSTHPIAEFIDMLYTNNVARIVDVRTIPRSLHNPQFNKTALPRSLKKVGIGYTHMAGLGGLRHTTEHSLNGGWRNASFRGYADYMQTPEFAEGLEALMRLARTEPVAIMCAEAVPWRCHRSLIADALIVHGVHVEDIMSSTRRQVHTLTSFAHVRGTALTYPSMDPQRESTESKVKTKVKIAAKVKAKVKAKATRKKTRSAV